MAKQSASRNRITQPRIDRLRPLGSDWEWQMRAACRSTDSAVFFPPTGEGLRARRLRESKAKAVCGRCPVRRACLEQALAVGEPYGVWGGLAESERRAVTAVSA
ncbi:Transcriptional regulator WhiB [Rhodococcus sp. RD6.2]|jgi:WhiB family redox-sensing transcriptional regulator|nr:Transcriptional regulator WhiB [Rhodococcus sp. RD6.2]